MAAAIDTNATTLEAQVLEVATALGELEKAQSTDNVPLNNVTIDTDLENNLVTITISLPVAIATTASGFSVAADPYLA
ncbi:hypothetical protein PGN35_000630 [Nodosilinea sp. PGN35]|uniref:hypothetical protein n=1 Tax=Nodosilinea sp. PGN35 TaxID=3020489 RepID=UPI0023B27F4B|nr:hypothetical protein [Nodosilinea sp. TSF1-S3]MDF0369082.1 hypothetical protein [Nodosilinea sp. TSF1-S3]